MLRASVWICRWGDGRFWETIPGTVSPCDGCHYKSAPEMMQRGGIVEKLRSWKASSSRHPRMLLSGIQGLFPFRECERVSVIPGFPLSTRGNDELMNAVIPRSLIGDPG